MFEKEFFVNVLESLLNVVTKRKNYQLIVFDKPQIDHPVKSHKVCLLCWRH
jgi:hypothetical protein